MTLCSIWACRLRFAHAAGRGSGLPPCRTPMIIRCVPNGINLSRRFFASQALAEDFSRLRHAVVFFGSAFDDARFVAVGTFLVHLEVAQLGTGPSRSQSAQRVGKADAFHGNLLAVRGLHHDGAY
jgi:hypothetical protein